jgi:hypothetical protein
VADRPSEADVTPSEPTAEQVIADEFLGWQAKPVVGLRDRHLEPEQIAQCALRALARNGFSVVKEGEQRWRCTGCGYVSADRTHPAGSSCGLAGEGLESWDGVEGEQLTARDRAEVEELCQAARSFVNRYSAERPYSPGIMAARHRTRKAVHALGDLRRRLASGENPDD